MTARRTLGEAAALVVLAGLCAALSNALAGPTRRLPWRPAPAVVAVPAPLPPPVPSPTPPPAPRPAPHLKAPASPGPEAAPSLQSRFPPLADRAESDIDFAAARWLQTHGALVLDARRTAAYESGHLPGARSLPVWEDGLDAKVADLEAFAADLRDPVVIYCAGGGCEDSHLLAQKLFLAGFRNLRIYAGGYPDWAAKGAPVRAGNTP